MHNRRISYIRRNIYTILILVEGPCLLHFDLILMMGLATLNGGHLFFPPMLFLPLKPTDRTKLVYQLKN